MAGSKRKTSGGSSPKKKKGRKGGRASADGRKIERIYGTEHRIYRKLADPKDQNSWIRCGPESKYRKPDSRVHRHGREKGFTNSPRNVKADDDRKKAARKRANKVTRYPKSTVERVTAQSAFECFAMKAHPNDEYTKFLKKLDQAGEDDQIALMVPDEDLLISYIYHMRDDDDSMTAGMKGRRNKGGNINKNIDFISGTLRELGRGKLERSEKLSAVLKGYVKEDGVTQATAFNPEVVMPKLWEALWKLEITYSRKVALWSRFLVQFGVIARSSDVTGEYCPLLNDCVFPVNPEDWCQDGTPCFIELVWTDWKGRPESQQNAPYKIRLYHNPKDLRFCPVHWLLKHWGLRRNLDGPILESLTAASYQASLALLFECVDVDCSSHSIRRAAAQWAARCGGSLATIRNIGRWVSLKHLLTYIAEGVEMRTLMERDHRGRDPILDFYPFNPRTEVSAIATSRETMLALTNHANQ